MPGLGPANQKTIGPRIRSIVGAIGTVSRAPASRTFIAWRFYRSRVVPLCLLVALLSVLFAGALTLDEQVIQPTNETRVPAFGSVLAVNLTAASMLMLCHALYLCLMAWHLVYRFPVERIQPISLVYVPITFAYFAHASHAYEEATHEVVMFHAPWLSSAAFAITYLFMAAHGAFGSHAAPDRRPTQHLRARWMMFTDWLVFAVTGAMFIRDIGRAGWLDASTITAALEANVPESSLIKALYAQSSPKDVIVILALFAYFVTKVSSSRTLLADQTRRDQEVLAIQTFECTQSDLASTRSRLPQGGCWLDLGSGHGFQVRELICKMYESDLAIASATLAAASTASPPVLLPPSFPTKVIYLGKDRTALDRAEKTSATAFSVNTQQSPAIQQQFECEDMYSQRSRTLLAQCSVVHMAHVSYSPTTVLAALNLLRHANRGTYLLLRFTSNISFYRAISVSSACSPLWPYVHHHTHELLLNDLRGLGWQESDRQLIGRRCRITPPSDLQSTVDWCDTAYGEFSGDVAERYLAGLAKDGEQTVVNYDRLVVLTKS